MSESIQEQVESDGDQVWPMKTEGWGTHPYSGGILRARDIPKDLLISFLAALGITEDVELITRVNIDLNFDGRAVKTIIERVSPRK